MQPCLLELDVISLVAQVTAQLFKRQHQECGMDSTDKNGMRF